MNNNRGGQVFIWLITLGLLAYTAFRSVDLVQSTLPNNIRITAYAALAGLDGGVLAWLFWTTRAARGGIQRTIGTLMVVVDLAGVAAAVLGDTMLTANAGDAGTITLISVWLIPIVIVANIAATIIAHLFDPDQALRDAQRSVSDALELHKAEWLKANAASIAAGVAPEAAEHMARQMVSSFQANSRNGNGKATAFQAAFPSGPAVPASEPNLVPKSKKKLQQSQPPEEE